MNHNKNKPIWFNNEGVNRAEQYAGKRRFPAGTTSTLRKIMKAQRIAGDTDILTPIQLQNKK